MIIGITGSVGKSSAKEAVYAVLKSHFKVRRNIKSYNNELGVPLTILGLETGKKSVFKWLRNFLKAFSAILWQTDYPQILVLEMGADKPNDIKYLTDFACPKISVVTAIGQFPVHLEFFLEKDDLIKEKTALVQCLPKDGTAILNYDDLSVRQMRENVPQDAKRIFYGFGQGADIQISNFSHYFSDFKKSGISFKIQYQGSIVPFRISKTLGKAQAYAAAAAAAAGLALGLNLVEISNSLKKYKSLPGRTNLIEGVKQTIIIDDSYNSSPSAAVAALETLAEFKNGRKIAVLADMLELGKYTEDGHRLVGQKAAQTVDLLYAVGARAKFISDQAKKEGLYEERIFEYDLPEDAALAVQAELKIGDIILVKGSRAMKMEKVVKELMAHPEKDDKLLVK